MNENNDFNNQTFGEGGNQPPYTPPIQSYVTYIPYGYTPKTYEERRQIKKTANIIGGSLLVINVVAAIISFTLTLFLAAFGMNGEQIYNLVSDAGFNQFFNAVASSLLFILPFTIFFKASGHRISDLANYSRPKKKTALPLFFIGISFCAFSNMATSIAGSIFQSFGINYDVDMGEYPQGLFGFLLTVIAIAVVPPLVEEFACRGLILGSLRKFGDGFSIVVSAAVFGIMHGNFQQIPFAFLVGLALGYITVKSGSLWVAVAVHAFNNFLSIAFNYLPASLPEAVKNAGYVMLLSVIMLLGLVGIILYRKNNENFEVEKSDTESSAKQKAKWFFSSVTIIIFLVVSFIESLAFFKT